MMYNTYGVYTGNPNDHGEISGNTIEHNRWCGVYFSSGTTYYSVFGNTFANNRTKSTGVKMNLGSPVAKNGHVHEQHRGVEHQQHRRLELLLHGDLTQRARRCWAAGYWRPPILFES